MNAKSRQVQIRKMSARYPRLIEWSAEDGVFVGSAPPLIGQCCHGATETEVATQLAAIVADLVADVLDGKMAMPEPPANKSFSGKFLVRISPELHRRAALQALARGESLNQFVAEAISSA